MPQRDSDESSRRRNTRSQRRAAAGTQTPAVGSSRRTRYVIDGRLRPTPEEASVAEAREFAEAAPGRMALNLFPAPTAQDVDELAAAWDLHPLLVEDLQHAGQRPKLERYGDVLFMVVRSARYDDAAEDVDFSEFHVLVRPHAIAVLCQDKRWIDGSDEATIAGDPTDIADRGGRTLLDDEHLLSLGPEAVAYRLLDAIVDGYAPVLRGLAVD